MAALDAVNLDIQDETARRIQVHHFVKNIWLTPRNSRLAVFRISWNNEVQRKKLLKIIDEYTPTEFFSDYVTLINGQEDRIEEEGNAVVDGLSRVPNSSLFWDEHDMLKLLLQKLVDNKQEILGVPIRYYFHQGIISVIQINESLLGKSPAIYQWISKQVGCFDEIFDPDNMNPALIQTVLTFLNSLNELNGSVFTDYYQWVGPLHEIDPNPSFYLLVWDEWEAWAKNKLVESNELKKRVLDIFVGMFQLPYSKERILKLKCLPQIVQWCPALSLITAIRDVLKFQPSYIEDRFGEMKTIVSSELFDQILRFNEHLFTRRFIYKLWWSSDKPYAQTILTRSFLFGPGRMITRADALQLFGVSYTYVDIIISMLAKRTRGPLFSQLDVDLVRKIAGTLSVAWRPPPPPPV